MDAIDTQIIAKLREHARSSFTEIGDAVGLSGPAVKRRVDRLEAEGTITGYHAAVAEPASTEAMIELTCRGKTGPQRIRAMLEGIPEVIGAWTVTGEADALIHVRCRTADDLEPVIEAIREHPSAERTKSVIVLSTLV